LKTLALLEGQFRPPGEKMFVAKKTQLLSPLATKPFAAESHGRSGSKSRFELLAGNPVDRPVVATNPWLHRREIAGHIGLFCRRQPEKVLVPS